MDKKDILLEKCEEDERKLVSFRIRVVVVNVELLLLVFERLAVIK